MVGDSGDLLETPLKIPSDLDSLRASREVDLSSPPNAFNARNLPSSCSRWTYK